MTGLDIDKDQIIEMACIVTDAELNILAEVRQKPFFFFFFIFLHFYDISIEIHNFLDQGPNLIINQPDKLLDGMSAWCQEHHGKVSLLLIFTC